MNTTTNQGFVYLITPRSTPLYKIGYTSTSIEKRMAQLQTGSATELQLIEYWEGNQGHESALHRKLAKYRTQGEWFRFPKIVLRELSLLEVLDVETIRLPDYSNEAQSHPIENLMVAARELSEISEGRTHELAVILKDYAKANVWNNEADVEADPLKGPVDELRLIGLRGREQKRFARIENSFKCFLHWKEVETRWRLKFGKPTQRAYMNAVIGGHLDKALGITE